MPSRRPLLALAVAVAAATVALALWWLLRDEPKPIAPRPTDAPAASAALPATSAGDIAPTDTTTARQAAPVAPTPAETAPTDTQPPLSGTVKELQGSSLPGMLVELLDADGNTLAATTSDEDGEFAFDRLVPGAAAISTRPAPDGLPRLRHGVPGKNRRGQPLTIAHLRRPPEGTITGIVVDDAGKPVAGAKITTDRPYRPLNRGPWQVIEGKEPGWLLDLATDAQGRFELPGCWLGAHTLRAVHGERSGSVVTDANTSGVVIRLGTHHGGAAVLIGRLTDRLTDAPLGDAEIRVQRMPAKNDRTSVMTATGRTDPQGHFEVQGLELGDYTVHPMLRGYVGATTKVAIESGHQVVELSMLPSRRVTVRVVLPDGQPIARVPVQVRDADGAIVQVPDDGHLPRDSLPTDATGRVTLRHLPAARATLLAVRGDFIPAGRVDVDLTYGAPDEVTVQLPTAVASFARQHFFKLMDADGKPAEIEGTVVASSFDGEQLLSRVEGRWRDGTFYLGNHQRVPSKTPVMAVGALAGACRVEIAAPGYQLVTLTLEPDAETPTTVTLRR